MSEVAEERLFGLVEIAERQQAVAQMALEGMAAERIALGQERQEWTDLVDPLSEDIRAAVLQAVSENMAGAAEMGAEAVKAATEPLLGMLTEVAAEARQAEAALRGIVRWTSWRLLGWGLATVAGLALVWWLAVGAVLWWDSSAIGAAQLEKVKLDAEIAELKGNRDAWVKAGMAAKLEQCGPKNRPCIPVDESAGTFGRQGDYRVIRDN